MNVSRRIGPAEQGGAPPESSSDPAGISGDEVRPESAAAYIADITMELAGMARASRLEILAYLLEIAQLEAANTTRRLARRAVAG